MKAEHLPTQVFGSLRARLGALMIDAVLLHGVLGPLDRTWSETMDLLQEQQLLSKALSESLASGLSGASWVTGTILYFGVLQAFWSGTIGKRLLGLRLVGADLQPIDWRTGVGRTLAMMISSLCLGAVGWSVAFHPRKRGWHDRVASTCVIQPARLEAALWPVASAEVTELRPPAARPASHKLAA